MKLSRLLNQTAVYWGSPVDDGYGGKSFVSGVEIDVRWEDKTEKFIDSNGEETLSHSWVFIGQNVDLGGYLFLGDLDDLSSVSEDDPTQEHAAYEIKRIAKIPDIKGTIILREAVL